MPGLRVIAGKGVAKFMEQFRIQPINYDDLVLVENQWGRIEEIALTYVVVRIVGFAPPGCADYLFYRKTF